jgi:hypothetical protein
MSQGAPTALVKDGTTESNDPVQSEPFKAAPMLIRNEVGASKGSGWAWLLVLLGVCAIVGGGYLLLEASSAISSDRFTPTAAQLVSPTNGQTVAPPDCADSPDLGSPTQEPALTIGPQNGDLEFMVPTADTVVIVSAGTALPRFGPNAALCLLNSTVSGGETVVAYLVEHPGLTTVYLLDRSGHTAVVRIDGTTSPATSAAGISGWVLIIIGALAIVVGGVVLRRRRVPSNDDLRRVGDDPRSGPYDPQRAQRAAWDALDQSAGQW